MKAILPAVLISLSTLVPVLSGQDSEPGSSPTAWADLRLPLPELKAFLDAAEKASYVPEQDHPPVAAAVLGAHLSLDCPFVSPAFPVTPPVKIAACQSPGFAGN